MITDADVTKLKKTFVTKTEFTVLTNKVDVLSNRVDTLTDRVEGITEKVGDLSVEVGEIHDKLDGLDVKFDAMLDLLSDSKQEHVMGAAHLMRHDRQIAALATATSTVLPD